MKLNSNRDLFFVAIILSVLYSCGNIRKEYYDSGELKAKYSIKDNKKNGRYRSYYKTGQLKYEAIYINDYEEGIYKGYYESGDLKMVGEKRKGLRDGNFTGYYKNGLIEYEIVYVNDSVKSFFQYDSIGNVIDNGRYIEVKKNIFQENEKYYLRITTNIFSLPQGEGLVYGNFIIRGPDKIKKQYGFDINKDGVGSFVVELFQKGIYKIDIYYYIEDDVKKSHDAHFTYKHNP